MPIVYITRRAQFAASHRLYREELTRDQNFEIYGPCARENGHGHNYVMEVTLRGEIDPATDMVMNLSELKRIMEEQVLKPMDHYHLNLDVQAFAGINPTAENLVVVIWNLLKPKIPAGMLYEVRVHETENNQSVYRGE